MNRAQRRAEGLFSPRPSSRFRGEFGRRADTATYQQVLRAQMEREANGEPIHPEIAAGLTKPREFEDLWQVGVTMADTKEVKFLGPRMGIDACRNSVEAINKQITSGQRSDWVHAEAYPMTRIAGA